MATSLQNLLSNQFSTQLGSLSAPVDPGAALANIIGGVGKTYTLGEQLRLAEAQDQAEIMRMQQAKEQERNFENQQMQQKQQMLQQQAEMERKRSIVNRINKEAFDLVKSRGLRSEEEVQSYKNKRFTEEGLLEATQPVTLPPPVVSDQQERVVGSSQPTQWGKTPQPPSEQPDIYETIFGNIPEKKGQDPLKENIELYKLYVGDEAPSIAQINSKLSKIERMETTSENALDTRGWTSSVLFISSLVPGIFDEETKNKIANTKLLKTDLNDLILKKAELMKGQLSDKDVAFLTESVSGESDPKYVRKRFLELIKMEAMTELARKKASYDALVNSRPGDRTNFSEIDSRVNEILEYKPIAFVSRSGDLVFTNKLEKAIRRRIDRRNFKNNS